MKKNAVSEYKTYYQKIYLYVDIIGYCLVINDVELLFTEYDVILTIYFIEPRPWPCTVEKKRPVWLPILQQRNVTIALQYVSYSALIGIRGSS